MNPELKKEWLEALESGKYKFGQRALHQFNSNTFCCLGVLCDILEERKELYSEPDKDNNAIARYYINDTTIEESSVGTLSYTIKNKYDIKTNHIDELVAINDNLETQNYKKQIKYIQDNL